MPVEDLALRAKMLRELLGKPMQPRDDQSLNQMREQAIVDMLSEVAEDARDAALREEVYSVGKTPEECIQAAAKAFEWGAVTKIEDLPGGVDDERLTWGRRFLAGSTGFKAAGKELPGGCVMTWWK